VIRMLARFVSCSAADSRSQRKPVRISIILIHAITSISEGPCDHVRFPTLPKKPLRRCAAATKAIARPVNPCPRAQSSAIAVCQCRDSLRAGLFAVNLVKHPRSVPPAKPAGGPTPPASARQNRQPLSKTPANLCRNRHSSKPKTDRRASPPGTLKAQGGRTQVFQAPAKAWGNLSGIKSKLCILAGILAHVIGGRFYDQPASSKSRRPRF